jgi:hypothetical protein
MKRASSIAGSLPPPGGSFHQLRPSYSKMVKMLLKRQFVLKPRKVSSIVEYAISLVIYIVLYPIFILTKNEFKEIRSPDVIPINQTSIDLLTFLIAPNSNPILRAIPDTEKRKDFLNNYFSKFDLTRFGYFK